MNPELEQLRADIEARYTSVHAFCRQHETLKRSTVYAVLAGRFVGQAREQIQKIREVLNGSSPKLTTDQITAAIQRERCLHCRPGSRRRCQRCRERTGREAQAVMRLLDEEETCRGH